MKQFQLDCVRAVAAAAVASTAILPSTMMPLTTRPSRVPSPTRSVTADLKGDGVDVSPLLAGQMLGVDDRLGR